MADRVALITDFLTRAGWGNAKRAPLAGDASARCYERLTRGADIAVLMDAPGGDIRPFTRVARHLSGLDLSAPEILAEDTTNGLLLLEDFGDALYARLVEAAPSCEEALYVEAVEVLIALHSHPAPAWAPDFGPATMTEAIAPAWDWYAKGITGSTAGQEAAQAELGTLLAETASDPVLILRDYHAENLFWLPDRDGTARVGLIDFQDALAGPRAYDLISLTEDARRDVDPALADRLIAHYATRTGQHAETFRLAAATCAAQRNLRILGIFARLSLHFGKPHYIDLIPRVWGLLQRDLEHPRLARLRECCHLPEPTPDNLQILRDKCGTIPTL
ncbi:aminoglycoside phosphotransferase family protein [Aliiroseovarius sp.]|uniref:aminoglycoside phosphotransferase family protein n=1 Tax=Aliiroseovarius sp. TaxID=1872442 RepID=UPI003BACCD95